jgi:hypothetical protein
VVVVDEPFFVPSGIRLRDKELYFEEKVWRDETTVTGHDGLSYQATWFAKYVSEGRVESEVHPASEVIAGIEIAAEICKQIGAEPL